jgi:hypothetical protein
MSTKSGKTGRIDYARAVETRARRIADIARNPPRDPHQPQERPPRNQNQDRGPSGAPILLIPLIGGTRFWENMAIGMDSAPKVGVANPIRVTILNYGALPAAGTIADFRWAKPSLGFDERHLFPIGKCDPAVVPKGPQPKPIQLVSTQPWTPTEGGHECLMVTCKALNDSQGLQPWQPQTERRCAQRNVTVVAVPVNESLEFNLDFSNLLPLRAVHMVLASVERVTAPQRVLEEIKPAALLMQVLGTTAAVRKVVSAIDPRLPATGALTVRSAETFIAQPAAMAIRSRLSKGLGTIGSEGANRYLANLMNAGERLGQFGLGSNLAGMSILHEAVLHPAELRNIQVSLQAPRQARRGDFLVYRLAQLAEGMLLGGYTAIVQVQ